MIGRITTDERGLDLVVEWVINDFLTLRMSDGAWYISPEFSFGGERWELWIFPNGSSENGSSGYVDLSLVKCGSNPFIRQNFSLSLKTAKGEKYKEQHCMKDFDIWPKNVYEFSRFISRLEVTRKKFELLPEDVLTVVCTMKSSTSSASDSEASRSSTNPHENKLHHDFKELFLQKEDCDVTIKVKGSEFPAHRLILKARSPVFASTFRHDMKEKATGIIEIDDCDSSSFSDFLYFVYCGDATKISQENVFGLFTTADKYQVLDLRAKCLEFIKKNISIDTFCETLTLALQHSETELIKLCTNYFKKNVPKIIVTVQWQIFLAKNPTASNELFVKSFMPNSSRSK